MVDHPFLLLRPFAADLRVALFTKDDDIRSDNQAASVLGMSDAAGLHQVHGKKIVQVDGPRARTEEADGMWTATKGLLLCTRWADCQNFIAYDPTKNVVGVLHAGWRGLVAGAIGAFIDHGRELFAIDPSDLVIGAGPSLCKKCAGFTDPVTELPGLPADLRDGLHADLQGWALRQFTEAGVLPAHIDRHPDCTRCKADRYWTYRGGHREEVKAGHTNMLAAVLE